MLELFRRWSRDRLFVLTTHSPIFLDSGNDRAHTYLLRRSEGATTVERADPQLGDVLSALGVRTSDVLSAERILLVEGDSDRDVLAAWWPEMVENARNAIIVAQGGRNARYAGLLDRWLREADRLDRPVLYLRDRDELGDEVLRKLRADRTVHVLERREIENYLLDPEALARFFTGRCVEADPAEIAAAARETADGLKRAVVVKSVAAGLGVVRLVDDRSRARLARNVTCAEDMIAAVTGRLPRLEELREQITGEWRRTSSHDGSGTGMCWRRVRTSFRCCSSGSSTGVTARPRMPVIWRVR